MDAPTVREFLDANADARRRVCGPDLERDADGGYTVRAYFRPSLALAGAPYARATVEILHNGAALDALDVPALDALEMWRHTGAYSSAYADALARRPDAETDAGE
jgi:hypothetical protein